MKDELDKQLLKKQHGAILDYDDLTNLEYIKKYSHEKKPYWVIKYRNYPKEIKITSDELVSQIKLKKALLKADIVLFKWKDMKYDLAHFAHILTTKAEEQQVYDAVSEADKQARQIYNQILEIDRADDKNGIDTCAYWEKDKIILSSAVLQRVVSSLYPPLNMRKVKEIMRDYLVTDSKLPKKIRLKKEKAEDAKTINVWYFKIIR